MQVPPEGLLAPLLSPPEKPRRFAVLTILGPSQGRFCDGISRRGFLKIGGLALGGMSLNQVLEGVHRRAVAPDEPACRHDRGQPDGAG